MRPQSGASGPPSRFQSQIVVDAEAGQPRRRTRTVPASRDCGAVAEKHGWAVSRCSHRASREGF